MKKNFYFLTWLGPKPNFSLKPTQPTPFFPHPHVAQLPQHMRFTWPRGPAPEVGPAATTRLTWSSCGGRPDRRSLSVVHRHRVNPPCNTAMRLPERWNRAEPQSHRTPPDFGLESDRDRFYPLCHIQTNIVDSRSKFEIDSAKESLASRRRSPL
jgi:hypothetical protein